MILPALFRRLWRARGLSLTVACTVAAGVAILTTAFALFDAAVLRAPPFPGADRLAIVYTTHVARTQGRYHARWAYTRIRMLRTLARSFSHIASYTGPVVLTLTGSRGSAGSAGEASSESVSSEIVSPSYFQTLGVNAAIGRTFPADDTDAAGTHPLAILSHRLWVTRFASDTTLIGRTIRVNRTVLTVVGIMPPGFRGLSDKAQLWVPTSMAPVLTYPEYLTSDQNFITVVARLAPNATIAGADAEMRMLGPRIYEAIPEVDADPLDRAGATAVLLNEARVHPTVRRAVLVLLIGVALLHLLACANATSLLLARALARRHELAVRLALGSGTRRLFWHCFAEGAVLTLMGGAAGMVLATWANALIPAPADMWGPRNFYGSLAPFADPAFSWRALLFGCALTVVSAIVVALAPALSARRVSSLTWIRAGGRGASEGAAPRGHLSAHTVLVVLETALAVVLLVVGALMIDSFSRMRATELGVDDGHVLTFSLQPPEAQVPTSAAPAFIGRLLDAITAVPGVVSATVDGGAPVSGTARSTLFIAGRVWPSPRDAPPVLRHYVAPAHFRTLGIPLLRGRPFTSQDIAGRPRVTIISESAARAFWPGVDPLGQRVWFGGGSSYDRPDSSAEIVGIARDVMYEPLDVGPNRNSFYTPYMQFSYGWRIYFVRAVGDPAALVPGIRQAVHNVESDLALRDVQPLRDLIGASWSRQRFDAWFFGGVASLALVLAASGIYSVVTYAVGRRTREMGIRLALGAQPRDIVRLVVRDGMVAPAIGLAVGTGAAFGAARFLRASLYGVAPTDVRVMAMALTLFLLVALIACAWPARRATAVDPCETLRAE